MLGVMSCCPRIQTRFYLPSGSSKLASVFVRDHAEDLRLAKKLPHARVLGSLCKSQCNRVHAISQAGGLGTIVEDMSGVSLTPAARDFRSDHAEAIIR